MEKTVKFTWSELIKWGTLIALIISLFVANQMDIAHLKANDKRQVREIKELREANTKLGESVARINGTLDEIDENVDTIKDAIISSVFVSDNVGKND